MMLLLLLSALGFDYDEILMLCMGLAAAAYVVLDFKREKRLDDMAVALAERVSQLEVLTDRSKNLEDRLAAYAERIAVLETKIEALTPTNDEDTEAE